MQRTKELKSNSIKIIDEFHEVLRNRQVNIAYYNLIFLEDALLMHHLHTTFRPWLIHAKPYKNPVYQNKNIEDILNKSEESYFIPYSHINCIYLNEKTLLKNLKIEVVLKTQIKGLLGKNICFYKKQKSSLSKLYENLSLIGSLNCILNKNRSAFLR